MPHAHKVARYMQLLRNDPKRLSPRLKVTDKLTPEDVKLWKTRIRAFDEAVVRLGLKTAAQVNAENSAFAPCKTSRIVAWPSYAGIEGASYPDTPRKARKRS
jgi:hypothetical protein